VSLVLRRVCVCMGVGMCACMQRILKVSLVLRRVCVCVHGCRHVCLYALRARSKSRCILYICADIVLCQRMNPVIEAVCTKALYFGIGSVLDLFS